MAFLTYVKTRMAPGALGQIRCGRCASSPRGTTGSMPQLCDYGHDAIAGHDPGAMHPPPTDKSVMSRQRP